MIRIGEAMTEVDLQLRATNVTSAARIFVRPALLSKKITRHMLDRIQAQPVAFRLVDQIAH